MVLPVVVRMFKAAEETPRLRGMPSRETPRAVRRPPPKKKTELGFSKENKKRDVDEGGEDTWEGSRGGKTFAFTVRAELSGRDAFAYHLWARF